MALLAPASARAVRWISLALLAALVITPLAQILMRGVFNVPMSGAEELARYFLIYADVRRGVVRDASRAGRSGWRSSRG